MMDFIVSVITVVLIAVPSGFLAARVIRGIRQEWYAVYVLIGGLLLISLLIFLPLALFNIFEPKIVIDLNFGLFVGSLINGIEEINTGKSGEK